MLEKYLSSTDKTTLDLTKLKLDSPKLKDIKDELETRFDIVNLSTNFTSEHFKFHPLTEILCCIDRNQKKAAIAKLLEDDPDFSMLDVSYIIKGDRKLLRTYSLTKDDFSHLLEGLKHNTHLKILVITGLSQIKFEQFIVLAEVLKTKNITALYCQNSNFTNEEIEKFIGELEKHKSLIQLTMSNEHCMSNAGNAQTQTVLVAKCPSLEKLKTCIREMKYIPGPDRVYKSSEVINSLDTNIDKIPEIFGLRNKAKELKTPNTKATVDDSNTVVGVTSATSTQFILQNLPPTNPPKSTVDEKSEEELGKLIKKVSTLEELKEVLLKHPIKGSGGAYTPSELIELVELVLQGKIPLQHISRYAGLRSTVVQIRDKDSFKDNNNLKRSYAEIECSDNNIDENTKPKRGNNK